MLRLKVVWLFFVLMLLSPFSVMASDARGATEKLVPRTIIALYDSSYQNYTKISATMAHKFAEMPLNHLGMIVEYHDVKNSLPDIKNRADVRGVLTWFDSGETLNNPVG